MNIFFTLKIKRIKKHILYIHLNCRNHCFGVIRNYKNYK